MEAEAQQAIGADGFTAFEVRVSFLEVYRESAFCLLGGCVSANRDPSGACAIREQSEPVLRIYAEGAKDVRVTSASSLLELVARGAANRATAATGVHAHSSRSHALLVISVEHRWRDVNDPEARRVKSRTARLTLVDLAGAETMERSHGGNVDAAGVGTNLGLLVLGRVTNALASGERVPYRDSTLTRLLQTSLGGNAITQMLTCVSPAAGDSDQTWRTLQYASSARDVRCRPQIERVREELVDDPMADDCEDEDAALNRRTIWIETRCFGDVFARCVGDPSDPLILWVHGSGPRNSSMFWNEVVIDVTRLAASNDIGLPTSFYQVAIDCPGYGRSPGDRQTIRSYPGAFLTSVIEALGRRTAAAICGSSQGAASTFNAILECPKLALALAVCHPVGHAPQRYTAIPQPTLMIFDTEDAGHPVAVGRQMRRYLPNNRYFEFTRSTDGDWEAKHMGDELLKLMAGSWKELAGKRRGGRIDRKMPELTRLAGGFRAWSEKHGSEWLPMGSKEGGWESEAVEAEEGCSAGDVWRAILDSDTNVIRYQHVESGRISKVRPPGVRVLVERVGQGGDRSPAPAACRVGGAPESLFEHSESEEDEDDRLQRKQRENQEAEEEQAREDAQTSCDLCSEVLLDPIRLTNCRCALCACCVQTTVRYLRSCPVCSEAVSMKTGQGQPKSDADGLMARLAQREADESDELGARLRQRREELKRLRAVNRRSCRVVLEYGNTAKLAGSKTCYTTFVKMPMLENGLTDAKNPIAKVDFNINPGYSKPTSTVTNPAPKTGALFEYAMARSYPCFITVSFKKEWGLPEVCIEFVVQDEPKTTRRIVVEMPTNALGGRRPGLATFDAKEPRNGWIRCHARQEPMVEYGDGTPASALPALEPAVSATDVPAAAARGVGGDRGSSPAPTGASRGKSRPKSGARRSGSQRSTSPARSSKAAPAPPAQPVLVRSRSAEIKDQFHAMNFSSDGMVDASALMSILQGKHGTASTGLAMSETQARTLLEAVGVGVDGRISFDRFVEYVHGVKWSAPGVY
eukprot:TRINITY_DN17776_c1_g1_i1.p1 TRINITY_DN17776_c1_g1~~TRINITY_DN17776_c1_g1_i1.p1  ORF type:complete len:1160 (-),score=176.85 TRINITY_DN17776_c1_g1_i1:286-3390(-)